MANTINKSKKPRSKRGTVRLRHKIEKAAAAKQRKARKQAKKDPTWRSRLKKDPGIPNLFPYKEKLLYEIEQRKLRMQEQAATKREQTLAATAGEDVSDGGGCIVDELGQNSVQRHSSDDETAMDIDEKLDEAANPMAALLASARAAAQEYDRDSQSADAAERHQNYDDAEEDGQEIHALNMSRDRSRRAFDKAFKQVVEQADVVLYVLDARDPEGTRSHEVERAVMAAAGGGKRLILILNKADLVPPPVLHGWVAHLRRHFPTLPLRAAGAAPSAKTFTHKNVSINTSSVALMHSLKSFAASKNFQRTLSVGVVGYPNVGKSSVINALLSHGGRRANACPTGAEAGVTTSIRSVKIDSKLTLLDSPGICFPAVSDSANVSEEDAKAHLVLLNAVPPKQIDDPVGAVSLLLKRLATSQELLQNLFAVYNVPPLISAEGDCTNDFLVQVARRRGRLGRGGIPNLDSAAMAVVADWRDGRIPGWVEPPGNPRQRTEKKAPDGIERRSTDNSGENQVDVDRAVIVAEWATEFKLDGLWGDDGDDQVKENPVRTGVGVER